MADIKVELDKDDINKAIADAIVQSVLGEHIVEGVKKYVHNVVTSSYANPIDEIIKKVVNDKVQELVLTVYKDQIEEAVKKKFTGDAADRLVNLAVEKFIKAVY